MHAATPRFGGLTAKQAKVTVAVVLVLGMVASLGEMLFDWRAMRAEVSAQVQQILETIDGSAVEAAYQLSPDLSAKVVDGLMGYEFVESARMVDNFGDLLAERRRGSPRPGVDLADRLFGDIAGHHRVLARKGDNGQAVVGTLSLQLSPQLVARGFYDRAVVNVALGLAKALAIVALVGAVFTAMITRPLVRLSQVVGRVDPQHPGARLVEVPPGHAGDELGELVGSLNALLRASQQALDQRDMALAENLRLGAELDVSRRIGRMALPTD